MDEIINAVEKDYSLAGLKILLRKHGYGYKVVFNPSNREHIVILSKDGKVVSEQRGWVNAEHTLFVAAIKTLIEKEKPAKYKPGQVIYTSQSGKHYKLKATILKVNENKTYKIYVYDTDMTFDSVEEKTLSER
jgi:uncharacterized protein (DUF2147 family)